MIRASVKLKADKGVSILQGYAIQAGRGRVNAENVTDEWAQELSYEISVSHLPQYGPRIGAFVPAVRSAAFSAITRRSHGL